MPRLFAFEVVQSRRDGKAFEWMPPQKCTQMGYHAFDKSNVATLTCMFLQAIARIHPRSLHPHWPLLLPTDQKKAGSLSLLALMTANPSAKLRSAAANALQALLQRSRTYLAVKSTSYAIAWARTHTNARART